MSPCYRAVFLVVFLGGCAGETATLYDLPFVVGSSRYDAGSLSRNSVVENTFTICNGLSEEIFLSSPRTSCGCTAAEYEKAHLLPGEETTLRVAMELDVDFGRDIRVILPWSSKDGEQTGSLQVEMHATVFTDDKLIASSGSIVLDRQASSQEYSGDTEIAYYSYDQAWPQFSLEHPPEILATITPVQQVAVKAGLWKSSSRLTVVAQPQDLTTEALYVEVDVVGRTESIVPSLSIPIVWDSPHRITVIPSMLYVGQIPDGTSVSDSIAYRLEDQNDEAPVAETSCRALRVVRIDKTPEGGTITVLFDSKDWEGSVALIDEYVQLSIADEKVVTVPIRGKVVQ